MMSALKLLLASSVVFLWACPPKPVDPPVDEPKDYVINYFDFRFEPDSKVYVDSSLHIHASFPAWALTSLKAGIYDVMIEGFGQKGPDGWPILGIAFNDSESFENIAVFDTSIITQQVARVELPHDSATVFLYLANDSYDRVTKQDCNVFIKKLTFKKVVTRRIRLLWDSNTEADLAGYRVYQNQKQIAQSVLPVFEANFEAGLLYQFSVTAFDNSGNESDHSEEINVVP